MSRELRRVHPTWEHPKDTQGNYIPLSDGFDWDKDLTRWLEVAEEFESEELAEAVGYYKPNSKEYMPRWTEDEATHYQWYETVSEGTPVSPPMASKEALAAWLSGNHLDRLSGKKFTKEQWLKVVNQEWVISGVLTPEKGFQSGTEYAVEKEEEDV